MDQSRFERLKRRLRETDMDDVPVVDADEAFEDRVLDAADFEHDRQESEERRAKHYAELDAQYEAEEEAEYQAMLARQVTPIGKQVIYPRDLRRGSRGEGRL